MTWFTLDILGQLTAECLRSVTARSHGVAALVCDALICLGAAYDDDFISHGKATL